MIFILLIVSFIYPRHFVDQNVDKDLLIIKGRFDKIVSASADVTLKVDIDFIEMPVKTASLEYRAGEKLKIDSEDFLIIPKRGIDLTWDQLFEYQFMTIDRGIEEGGLKVLNVIPLDDKSDYAIMTLKLDTLNKTINYAEVTTKNEGTFNLAFQYKNQSIFPSVIEATFLVNEINIPLNFVAKEAKVDKAKVKSDEVKEGTITLEIDWKEIK